MDLYGFKIDKQFKVNKSTTKDKQSLIIAPIFGLYQSQASNTADMVHILHKLVIFTDLGLQKYTLLFWLDNINTFVGFYVPLIWIIIIVNFIISSRRSICLIF